MSGVDPALEPEFLLNGPVRDGDGLLSRTVRAVRGSSARAARARLVLVLAVAMLVVAALIASGVLLGRPPVNTFVATTPGSPAWVRVQVRPYDGGSAAAMSESGLPDGATCQLVLVTREGTRLPIGGYRVGTQSGSWPMVGSAWVGPDDVIGVVVQVGGGPELVG
ncbi:MAG TPA: hypothetical protein VJ914_13250 [Pseudonocardiaceae bacterium]|nr:hypothetical protein [Pseudonocardiaceae bacterium]